VLPLRRTEILVWKSPPDPACLIWAGGRYKTIPQLGLAIYASERLYGGRTTVAELQRRYERHRLPFERYRRLVTGPRLLVHRV